MSLERLPYLLAERTKKFGAAVTFSRTTQTYNEETGATTSATTTIDGYALRDDGEPERYAALGLVASKAPMLLFAPTTLGETPAVGDTVEWESAAYTVRDVDPVAPQGTLILGRIVVST